MASESQKARSAVLRGQILDTALQIGLEEGFGELSVRKIIRRMNYSTSIIYYHFHDKQEIIDALVETESRRLAMMINKVVSGKNGLRKNLENAFRFITELVVNEPEKFNLIVLRKYSSVTSGNSPWIEYIRRDMEKAIARGEMHRVDPGRAAFCVWSSFLGFHLMLSLKKKLTKKRAEELFRVQFRIILNGIIR